MELGANLGAGTDPSFPRKRSAGARNANTIAECEWNITRWSYIVLFSNFNHLKSTTIYSPWRLQKSPTWFIHAMLFSNFNHFKSTAIYSPWRLQKSPTWFIHAMFTLLMFTACHRLCDSWPTATWPTRPFATKGIWFLIRSAKVICAYLKFEVKFQEEIFEWLMIRNWLEALLMQNASMQMLRCFESLNLDNISQNVRKMLLLWKVLSNVVDPLLHSSIIFTQVLMNF